MAKGKEEATFRAEGVTVKKVTGKAMLCEIEGSDYWIPKSQIKADESEVADEGDEGVLVMTQWIAEQKGLA